MTHSSVINLRKSTPESESQALPRLLLLVVIVLGSGLGLQSLLETPGVAQSFISPGSWQKMVRWLGGELLTDTAAGGQPQIVGAILPYLWCLMIVAGKILLQAGLLWGVSRFAAEVSFGSACYRVGRWWSLLAIWGMSWMFAWGFQAMVAIELLQGTVVFWIAMLQAGVLWEIVCSGLRTKTADKQESSAINARSFGTGLILAGMIGLYLLVFVSMNWGLWFNLRIPHGDSVMYEEHLWNVLHGKGFRSYLDQGLFWGEHIQFVHLFLLPFYYFWRSHLVLELAESIVLAIGAIPVYHIAARASKSSAVGLLLAAAYLLYFPLQFLDIAIDLKTFRPIAFGVAPVLWALDYIERQRFGKASLFLLFALTCKEDYAIVIFSIGLVLLLEAVGPHLWSRLRRQPLLPGTSLRETPEFRWGLTFLVVGPVYLMLALKTIRWFRSGVEVHYAGYFAKFGNSPLEIVWNMLTDPVLLFSETLNSSSLIYLLAVLVPLGLIPLRGGLKFIGCLPMLVLLCLNELAQDPRHHFHAPLIPLLFWAAVQGMTSIRSCGEKQIGIWMFCSAVATGLWFSLSPLGVAFWDPGSRWNGSRLYFVDERARQFAFVEKLIPDDARVASTDYVHARLTHRERSYDYSEYARQVSGGRTDVPHDTDWIVIDTRHPYSTIQSPAEVRELRAEPDLWELLPDQTRGYFIVLKRRK